MFANTLKTDQINPSSIECFPYPQDYFYPIFLYTFFLCIYFRRCSVFLLRLQFLSVICCRWLFYSLFQIEFYLFCFTKPSEYPINIPIFFLNHYKTYICWFFTYVCEKKLSGVMKFQIDLFFYTLVVLYYLIWRAYVCYAKSNLRFFLSAKIHIKVKFRDFLLVKNNS